MNSDDQSTDSFDKFTFEFTLSEVESDLESDTSIEYIGTNMYHRQDQNCTTGADEEINNSPIHKTSSITLTQQDAASSLLNLFHSNEASLNYDENNIVTQPLPIATSVTATNNSTYLPISEIQNETRYIYNTPFFF